MKPGLTRTTQEKPRRGRPARIVLAEDDDSMRRLVAAVLRRDGFEVLEIEDGVGLLERVGKSILGRSHAGSIQLIIADNRMPVLSGLDVLGRLRRADDATPFILITAFGDTATHSEAARLGASAVFDKPFDLDDLRLAVRHWT